MTISSEQRVAVSGSDTSSRIKRLSGYLRGHNCAYLETRCTPAGDLAAILATLSDAHTLANGGEEIAENAKCSCEVAFGQNPDCTEHGVGTAWRATNPEADLRNLLPAPEQGEARGDWFKRHANYRDTKAFIHVSPAYFAQECAAAINNGTLATPSLDNALVEAAKRLLSVFDQNKMTVAERIITGKSDSDLRREGNEAIEALRSALASLGERRSSIATPTVDETARLREVWQKRRGTTVHGRDGWEYPHMRIPFNKLEDAHAFDKILRAALAGDAS